MSQENVDIVKEVFASYERDSEVPSPLLHDDIVWNPLEEQPMHGIEDAIAYMERWTGEWDDYSHEVEEFIDAGDSVVIRVHFKGRGKLSGLEVDARLYEVWTIRDGKVARMDEFAEKAEALEAAGVKPE